MTGLQFYTFLFSAVGLCITLWASWSVVQSPHLKWKPLWIAGSFFSFLGFSINWSSPTALQLWTGVHFPVFRIFTIDGSTDWFVNVGVPIIAIVALVKTNPRKSGEDDNLRE